MKELILASSSPRRRELLSIITRRFTVQTSDCDEAIAPGTGPVDAVRELSLRKARAVWAQQPDQRGLAVIGSDTVVYIDGEILGKPHSHGEAAAMISRLAGRSHTVCTGVTVITAEETRTFHETTEVHFYPLTPQEVAWYCSLEEPYDKAGAYGIQAAGALLVQGLTGDYFNVMGLPIAALARTLGQQMAEHPCAGLYAITADMEFESHYGKRANKRRKMYNGMIPCQLYMYYEAPKFEHKAKPMPKQGFDGKRTAEFKKK